MVRRLDYKHWHKFYETALTPKHRQCVDDCFRAVANTIKENGFDHANDDRAEKLVSAITEYVVESMAQ